MTRTPPNRALVTGATGFIGWHLARRLQAGGWHVHALVRPQSQRRDLCQLLGEQNVHVHDGTMQNMLAIVEQANPDIVFHLASLFLAQHAPADVSRLVCSNIEFPAQLAQAMGDRRVRRLINTGTAWQHFENADYDPVNLYAATKQAFADLLRFYVAAGALHVVNLEIFDTYGPNDTRPKLFSLLRKTALSKEPLAMSAGQQEIDLVYIDDVIEAYLAAATRLLDASAAPTETFAVSSGNPLPLRQVVERWLELTHNRLDIQWGARPYRPREVMLPWNRGSVLPSWRPAIPLDEGIRRMEGLPHGVMQELDKP